jgi:hypothetical protein
MIERIIVVAVATACIGACGGTPPEGNAPWLLRLIEAQMAEPVANPPAYIARQEYEAGVFYYLPPRCCDIWSDLYDSQGALVCHPDGGITGGGDGICPPVGNLLREEIVWRDPRV